MVEVNGNMVVPLGGKQGLDGSQDPPSRQWPVLFHPGDGNGGYWARSRGGASWKWDWPFRPLAPDFGQTSKFNKGVTVSRNDKECKVLIFIHLWVRPYPGEIWEDPDGGVGPDGRRTRSTGGCTGEHIQSIVDAVDDGVSSQFQGIKVPCPAKYDGGRGVTMSVQVVWHSTPEPKQVDKRRAKDGEMVTPIVINAKCQKWEKSKSSAAAVSQTGDWIWTFSPLANPEFSAEWGAVLAHEIGHQLITRENGGFDHLGHNTVDGDNTDDPLAPDSRKSGPLMSKKSLTRFHKLSDHEARTIVGNFARGIFDNCCNPKKEKRGPNPDDEDILLPPLWGSAPPRMIPGVNRVAPIGWTE